MAGDWIKVETTTPDKPEILRMAGALNQNRDLVFGKWIRLWAWFDQHTKDGNARGVTSDLLDAVVDVKGFCAAAQEVGWLEQYEGGIKLPRFSRHNGKTAKNRSLTAKRVAAFKKRSGNAHIVTSALPREEKRREEIKDKGIVRQKPDVLAVLNFLNEKTGKAYQPVRANVELIAARMAEGASVDDLRAVIAKKCREWSGDEKMAQYLRPKTLFSRTNFANYRGEIV